MGVRVGGILTALCLGLGGLLAGPALASGPVGSDPSSNFPVGPLPHACTTDPGGAVCVNASVGYLNQARASLGQPPYSLPADFASLSPVEQALILTNSDRVLYNLAPITGLTSALNQDAAAGVTTDSDPQPSASDWYGYTSNAAWGNGNMVLAYEGWMYDDGPGSDNVDCSPSHPSGCWGHRHDILWQFGPGALAMGAAAGLDSSGNRAYTMLLVQGSPSFNPLYTYTWSQALADLAGGGGALGGGPSGSGAGAGAAGGGHSAGGPFRPVAQGANAGLRITSLSVRAHRLTVRLASPGGRLRCSLRSVSGHLRRTKSCTRRVSFGHLPAGRYQLRVSSGAGALTRRVRVR